MCNIVHIKLVKLVNNVPLTATELGKVKKPNVVWKVTCICVVALELRLILQQALENFKFDFEVIGFDQFDYNY